VRIAASCPPVYHQRKEKARRPVQATDWSPPGRQRFTDDEPLDYRCKHGAFGFPREFQMPVASYRMRKIQFERRGFKFVSKSSLGHTSAKKEAHGLQPMGFRGEKHRHLE